MGTATCLLILTGCNGDEPEDSQSPTASETALQGEDPTPPIALDSVCDLLLDASAMPRDDELEYVDNRHSSSEFSVNCALEPADWDAALGSGYAARDDMTLVFLLESDLAVSPFEPYGSGRPAEDYLTAEHSDILPAPPDGWPDSAAQLGGVEEGYFYEFVFGAKLPQSTTEHKIQFFVPGSDGSAIEEYRAAAYATFTAYMDALAAEL